MLLGTLGASLLGNLLTGRGAIAKSVSEETKSKSHRRDINKNGKGIIRAGEGIKKSARQGKGVVRAGYGRPLSSASQTKTNKKKKQ